MRFRTQSDTEFLAHC